jgi:uncharacterized membrane protein HdeD (DUF308 family)
MGHAGPGDAASPDPAREATPSAQVAEREQIAHAAELYAPLRRAAGWAGFSGICLLVFGLPTLLLGLLELDPTGLILGACLCACGAVERASAKRVRAGDVAALTRLGWNQWAVFGLIGGYAALAMLGFDPDQARELLFSPETVQGLAELEAQGHHVDPLAGLGELLPSVVYTVYTTVILASFLMQGAMARMYFRRRQAAARYVAEVPAWIRQVVQGLSV